MSLAPASSKDGFSYAGDLFVEASGHNRHRRATIPELKDHFKSGSDKDHPAHWFEAQCIHYGLQPSKTKAVARMRLFDAVNGGKLAVPSHIKKLESELKKEWTKNEREAKKAIKDTSLSAAKSTKRKAAADSVDLTLNVGGINITVSANSAAKKSKTTTKATSAPKTSKTTTTPKTATPKATPSSTAKSKAKAPASSQKKASSAVSSSAPALSTPTARGRTPGGRGGIHQGPGRSSVPAPSPSPAPPRRTQPAFARCSRGRGQGSSFNTSQRMGHNDGLVYLSSDDDYSGYGGGSVKDEDEDEDADELKPLGLLNGRYTLSSDEDMAYGYDLSLVLTLNGSQLWGSFDLGIVRGVLRLENRPYMSSYESLDFNWRGRQDDAGKISFGDNNWGWIKFLGDGKITGFLSGYDIPFTGQRMPGQGTRSEIDAATMRAEWNCYTYELYTEESSGWY
ncbi:uncharacterized protein F4807DRAFT_59781 [Annulohypoxylon truncatum]|uniref:uncharacterized protein n=1 Tax=Annulohypoxylon truncatum TaxID=327061 RepID=UPI0020080CE7|nr:uncharacterized protein F4807DRAFT_59781 [Annulohypoxylon truncatum]KAI1210294.1 hypothetical protein F4807DRAFT_59781 [Annulohypoxylon truncatum]